MVPGLLTCVYVPCVDYQKMCVGVCVCVMGLVLYLFYGSLEVATSLVPLNEARLVPRAC